MCHKTSKIGFLVLGIGIGLLISFLFGGWFLRVLVAAALISGGEVDTERAAKMLVGEFRASKWGRISLERPPQRAEVTDWEGDDADEDEQ